ncbi:MAG: AraC family transcriptional regulator [Sphingobacteriia bacterium]|nr:AraC family transcriptional regulator [Sphingobacteriia bacterium]
MLCLLFLKKKDQVGGLFTDMNPSIIWNDNHKMTVIIFIANIVLTLILLCFNAKKFSSLMYLGLFFVLMNMYSFGQYLIFTPREPHFGKLVALNVFITACMAGPVLYFYVRTILTDSSKMSINDIWHLLPVLCIIISATLYGFIPETAFFFIVPTLMMAYTILSSIKIFNFKKHDKEKLAFSSQSSIIPWISILLGLTTVAALSMFFWGVQILFFKYPDLIPAHKFLQNLLIFALTGAVVATFVFPCILYGMPQLPHGNSYCAKSMFLPQERPVIASVTSKDYLLHIQQKTDALMVNERPWLQSQCNLSNFAKIANLPAHHLACYFRYIKKQSFIDYRNGWRIEQVKKLLSQSNAMELSLQEIGFLSGFSTRLQFFRAFKKAEGFSIHKFLSQNFK